MASELIREMSSNILIPEDVLDQIIRSSPYRYKVYKIPKKSGKGVRKIAQPAKEVKRLQYWIIDNIFPFFEIHQSATAYVSGKNIFNNTQPHCCNPYILKLDFKNFFPSIKGGDFIAYCKANPSFRYSDADLERLTRILFWRPKREEGLQLSIGAPSSPQLSNAILFQFDSDIYNFCQNKEICYTRYADDMTFSMHDKFLRGKTEERVKIVLNELPFPRLELNQGKTVYGSKAHRRMVTGLILSNDNRVSLGRDKKRMISSQIHHFKQGSLSEKGRTRLRGLVGFARSVEPGFMRRMEAKYGSDLLIEL